MAAILIRAVPEELHRWLKVEAALAGRTLEEECRAKLTSAMRGAKDGPGERVDAYSPTATAGRRVK